MSTIRNESIHKPSPNAKEVFDKQRLWNWIVGALLCSTAILAAWNIAVLVQVMRRTAPDLMDLDNLLMHTSAVALFTVGTLALLALVFKEWRYGERGLGLVFPAALWLVLMLVPVMTAETRSEVVEVSLEAQYLLCEPGSIAGDRHLDSSVCALSMLNAEDVRLAHGNPITRTVPLHAPDAVQNGYISWHVDGRDTFMVYVLVKQPSLSACEAAPARSNVNGAYYAESGCVEHDGAAWLVVPIRAEAMRDNWIAVYQESTP